ncbi:MAG TPA: carboxypeptidase-like regulatory domain-containing protein [Pyrinomonadaceae bacterium]|nr:carboxypeptidase-like regulatory domain-containing protein [Pyrinomonadaceae bacterium]
MIRTCPKCGAYYADESLAFCFADGMPLLSVAPDSETWQEGLRAIEEKTQSLRKHQRNLRLRRVVLGGVTTLILATVLSRSYEVETIPAGTIPPVKRSLVASPSQSPTTLPGAWPPEFLLSSEAPSPSSPTTDSSTPTTDSTAPTSTSDSSNPHSDTTTPTTDSSTPTTDSTSPTTTSDTSSPPSVFYRISGRVTVAGQPVAGVKVRLEGSKATTATTDGNGYYTFSDLRAGGSFAVTPVRDKTNFKPFNRSFDNLAQDGAADFFGDGERERDLKPESKCTEADEGRERKIIIDTYSAAWRESAERERQKVIRENTRDGEKAEATLVPREIHIVFFKECKAATVTYKYVWQIKTAVDLRGLPREINVSRQRTSVCGKMLGRWFCS